MDEDQKREFIEDFIFDLVRGAEFVDVSEAIQDYNWGTEDEELARELHNRIVNAKVEVKFD